MKPTADSQLSPSDSRHIAFKTWEAENESLESVEARIHDGVPTAHLKARAAGYLESFHRFFPDVRLPKNPAVMEIGSGVGYVLEAALQRYTPSRLVGLDVASGMIEKARQRLDRDKIDTQAVEFVHYDGVNAPLQDRSFDLIYSVASLQHAPRPYCYRALIEAQRMIKPGGFVCIHLLAYSHFKAYMTPEIFKMEVAQQIDMAEGHWHHFYSTDEIDAVLNHGMAARGIRIIEQAGAIYLCFSK